MRVLTGQPVEGIIWPQCHRHRVALLNEGELGGQVKGVVRVLAHQGCSCNGAFAHHLQPRPTDYHLGRATRVHGVNEKVCDRGVSCRWTGMAAPHTLIIIYADVGVVVLVVLLGFRRAESVASVLYSVVTLHSHKNIIVWSYEQRPSYDARQCIRQQEHHRMIIRMQATIRYKANIRFGYNSHVIHTWFISIVWTYDLRMIVLLHCLYTTYRFTLVLHFQRFGCCRPCALAQPKKQTLGRVGKNIYRLTKRACAPSSILGKDISQKILKQIPLWFDSIILILRKVDIIWLWSVVNLQ